MEFLSNVLNTLIQVALIYILFILIGGLHNHDFFEGMLVGIILSLVFKVEIIKFGKKSKL